MTTIVTKESPNINRQWEKILEHPVLRPEDHFMLRILAVIAGYMLRSPRLKERKKYKQLGDDLKNARKYVLISRNRLLDTIKNEDLFDAIKLEGDWMPLFHIFESVTTVPEDIRSELRIELLHLERLLLLYDMLKKRLGGKGRKGDDAAAFIIRFLNNLSYFRTGEPLSSKSNLDIDLVRQLYKEATHVDIPKKKTCDKVREVNKKWYADEVASWITEGNKLLGDRYLALYFAASKTLKGPQLSRKALN
jgi:hypothetical protein